MVQHSLLPPAEGHLSAQPFINNCYSEMCMSQATVDPHRHEKKLGWVVAAIFIVADMVGGGVVAMPVAFKQSGLVCGILFMCIIAVIFEYTGYQLGVVWCKMMERHPHLGVCRKPFPEMAKRTIGLGMQRFTSVLGNITLFGISVVYLLLSSKILHYFVDKLTVMPVGICYVITVLAIVILPFTFLKSPGEFAHVIVIAMVTTVIAVMSILAGIAMDATACIEAVNYPEQNASTMILSLGIFLFSFSGHYVFPAIQHDMREPKDFKKSVISGFLAVVLLYMPLAIFGYTVYGDSMDTSIITSIQTSWIQVTANLMIAVHCIMTLVIVINPLNQEVEHYLKVSHAFGVGRVATRTTVLFIVLLVALTVPDFSPVMNVVGASTIPIGCVLLPSLFYLYAQAASEDQWRKGQTPTWREVIQRTDKTVLIVNIFILIVALGGGILGTYQGVDKLMKADFSTPCYLRAFTNEEHAPTFSISQRCCGVNWNISSKGTPEICTPRNFTTVY